LLVAAFHELQPLLEKALAQETRDDTVHEMAVTARGLAKAAEILAGQFTLVATNVPYLGAKKQDDVLKDYCERTHPDSASDLATCFVERCLDFCHRGGSTGVVTPQNWLFLKKDEALRRKLLSADTWAIVARLGAKAFRTPMWDFNVMLLTLTRQAPPTPNYFIAFDVSSSRETNEKAISLVQQQVSEIVQQSQLANPDATVMLTEFNSHLPLLSSMCSGLAGALAGDLSRFCRNFWEVRPTDFGNEWEFYQTAPGNTGAFTGREMAIFWQKERGEMFRFTQSVKHLNHVAQNWLRGKPNWGKMGIAISIMADMPATIYHGEIYDCACTAIVPNSPELIPALWTFIESGAYASELRKINQALAVSTTTILKVPFDLAHWQKVAAEKYPDGLPKPFSSDPTQWLFNGHPAGATPAGAGLHVAVARLLGYLWPRQTGSSFPDCPALGPDGLESLADDDGIVCLSATKGEPPAAERLRNLLAQALGSFDLKQLLATAGPKGSKSETLDEWLRDEFFEQHCVLFHHRPFVWHIWDGLKNGFSALVNYHKLTHANLEKLTFAYLGDWIRRQQIAVDAGEAGSDAKLQAAKELQSKLKLILDGEAPYDIFVRWKPLSQQAIGWNPDLNDGVRMNIRPFVEADVLRKKVKIKWEKDRGAEPQRDKAEYPWFWSGSTFTGNRVTDIHLTREQKKNAPR
jgi:hypothetical protein